MKQMDAGRCVNCGEVAIWFPVIDSYLYEQRCCSIDCVAEKHRKEKEKEKKEKKD